MSGQVKSSVGLWKLIRFAVQHSMRDLWRNRMRTVFALVCVMTGVAAVVALRSLAFMVGDELTTNLAQMNRGDIRVYASRGVPELVELSGQGDVVFNPETVDVLQTWARNEGADVSFARVAGFAPVKPIVDGVAVTAQLAQALYVDPAVYPYYDSIILRDPPGMSLADLFAAYAGASGTIEDPRPVVISSGLARNPKLNLSLGSLVQLGTSPLYYAVRGIAPSTSETILTNPSAAFLGDYAYLPFEDLAARGEKALPDQVFVKVPLGKDVATVEKSLINRLTEHFGTATDFDKELNRASVPELAKQNAATANVIDDLILVMGLASLLIGGIGIVNTMQVVVSRRMLEIAVLKTLGLKGYRVTFLFLVEALLMGVIGGLLGVALGVVLSYFVRGVGEEAFSLTLEWRLYPEAMVSGLFLGIGMTGLFGFLPTLIAGQVRPAIVLRPNEAQMPAAGLVQTLITLVVMIVAFGLLVSGIVEGAIDYGPVIMIVGAGALVGLFAGVITANTRLGQPLPEGYAFRVARQYERLDASITGAVGRAVGWLPLRWRDDARSERGRMAITWGLRALRQSVLTYGAAAVGVALASGIMLVVSQVWLPFGVGDVEPPNMAISAIRQGDLVWIAAWACLVLAIGVLIRRTARGLVGMIALGSLGISIGGLIGFGLGTALQRLIGGGRIWDVLANMSTGVVLVEGALALLCIVYVGYLVLVWGAGKMSPGTLMAIVSGVVLALSIGAASAAAMVGSGLLMAWIVVVVALWVLGKLMRRNAPLRSFPNQQLPRKDDNFARTTGGTIPGHSVSSVILLSVAVAAGSLLAVRLGGKLAMWGGIAASAVAGVWLWQALRRRYSVDGRLILREMSGRQGRVASTLLGLSVGIAGLAVVSLTTGAVSHLLEVQLADSVEGNLLIGDPTSQHGTDVLTILGSMDGVQSYSQVTTYSGVLVKHNGEVVTPFHQPSGGEQADPRENSNLEVEKAGIPLGITQRVSLDAMPSYSMKNGRALAPGDEDTQRIMIRESFVTDELGIKTGDRLMFLFENDPGTQDDVLMQFRVVGVISRTSEQTGLEGFGNLSVLPPGALPDTVKPEAIVTIAKIDESNPQYMDQVLVALSDVPGVFAFELSALTQLAQNLLNQLKAIPTLVAWLALMAGTAIIANTVALATQERRRQIGVMKAVGLKGRRVLSMLMIENGLIGLIAGLIGGGVGFLITVILVLASRDPSELKNTIEFSTLGWLVLMSIVVAIAAATLSAWSAAAEKPMNVLRYE